jgi:Fic family protein
MGHRERTNLSRYIWELPSWPELFWNSERILQPLGRVRQLQGKLYEKAKRVGFDFIADQIENEAISTAAIENANVDIASLRSSIARILGIPGAGAGKPGRYTDGLVQMLQDATENSAEPLTANRLISWQAALFPTGYSGFNRIVTGEFRKANDPMQVVSASPENETIHFQAPPSDRIQMEMTRFVDWFNGSTDMDGIVRAAQSHLFLVTIHPFEDGNGRVARALTDMALAQDEKCGRRFYSISSQILAERSAYYKVLETTQKSQGDITEWLIWFFGCMEKALLSSFNMMLYAEERETLWLNLSGVSINPRQNKVLRQLSESGKDGFQGFLTNSKYRNIAKTTRETAKRDLADLLMKGIIQREPGGGRSAAYSLIWPEKNQSQNGNTRKAP